MSDTRSQITVPDSQPSACMCSMLWHLFACVCVARAAAQALYHASVIRNTRGQVCAASASCPRGRHTENVLGPNICSRFWLKDTMQRFVLQRSYVARLQSSALLAFTPLRCWNFPHFISSYLLRPLTPSCQSSNTSSRRYPASRASCVQVGVVLRGCHLPQDHPAGAHVVLREPDAHFPSGECAPSQGAPRWRAPRWRRTW